MQKCRHGSVDNGSVPFHQNHWLVEAPELSEIKINYLKTYFSRIQLSKRRNWQSERKRRACRHLTTWWYSVERRADEFRIGVS
jgi:hypothetical protein